MLIVECPQFLTQPFKLKLQRAQGCELLLQEYPQAVVLIEPLATVGAIEDFLFPRVQPPPEERLSMALSPPSPSESPSNDKKKTKKRYTPSAALSRARKGYVVPLCCRWLAILMPSVRGG